MIDLHSHLLSGIDDGARDMEMSVAMARLAVEDGVRIMACTPHFMPGIYDTSIGMLNAAMAELRRRLQDEGVALKLVSGGDVHISPDLPEKLSERQVPTIGNSRYFLFEPPHHVLPPNLPGLCRRLLEKGYVPILTHPERLTWIEKHYDVICEIEEMGVPVQLTAKSVTGAFGKRPKYWSDRMLDEGRVDLIASDAHNTTSRPPGMSSGRDAVAARLGQEAADAMVMGNPARILKNQPLIEKKPRSSAKEINKSGGFWSTFGRRK